MKRGARCGFTLVECMLASAILGFIVLALFEGVIVSARVARENAEILAAEAVAWDAAWKVFNEDFALLSVGATRSEDLTVAAAPELSAYDTSPRLTVSVTAADEPGFSSSVEHLKKITADVAWGPAARRRSLSAAGLAPCLFRGNLGRAN